MGNATVYKQDEKMLYFSVHSDTEHHWFHDTEAKKYPKDFNIKQIVVNDYNHDETQLFVEVVRCKDCKHKLKNENDDDYYCETMWIDFMVNGLTDNDYCSSGERREK